MTIKRNKKDGSKRSYTVRELYSYLCDTFDTSEFISYSMPLSYTEDPDNSEIHWTINKNWLIEDDIFNYTKE